jgi:hypothetical protein
MRPWLDELGIAHRMQPSDADLPTPLQLSSAEMERYVGVYEDGIARFHVERTAAGLTISQQPKWAYYENLSTDRSPPVALDALGEHRFFWKPHGGVAPQLCAFRAPTRAGNMKYFGYSLRLFPRIA